VGQTFVGHVIGPFYAQRQMKRNGADFFGEEQVLIQRKSGEVQPKHGTPALVLLLRPFQSSVLQMAIVTGP